MAAWEKCRDPCQQFVSLAFKAFSQLEHGNDGWKMLSALYLANMSTLDPRQQ